MTLSPSTSIAQAKAWLRTQLDKGAECPVCTQHAKVYRRKINSGMARGLITMYRTYGAEWGHVPSTEGLSRLGGELARLRMWGLVEEATEKREDGGRAGWWRVTSLGVAFLRKGAVVPQYALIYDGRCLRLEGASVSIKDALGTKFSYEELMAGV